MTKNSHFQPFSPEKDLRLPRRKINSHKGTFGSVLVIGGSKEMPGAPVLTALSALRTGAGTVTKTTLYEAVAELFSPELMLKLIESSSGFISKEHITNLKPDIEKSSVIALGPGMGLSEEVKEAVKEVIKITSAKKIPVVIDADGLNAFAPLTASTEISNTIMTPHHGEISRLLGVSISEIEEDRCVAAQKLSAITKAITVLKGPETIICTESHGVICNFGTPYLATAGSGDVLTGVIASLIAQGLSLFDAACSGVYIHQMAGNIAVKKLNGPIIASDIIAALPEAIGVRVV